MYINKCYYQGEMFASRDKRKITPEEQKWDNSKPIKPKVNISSSIFSLHFMIILLDTWFAIQKYFPSRENLRKCKTSKIPDRVCRKQ